MAEGSVEEESGEMLGPTTATVLQPPAPSTVSIKDEVSLKKVNNKIQFELYLILLNS